MGKKLLEASEERGGIIGFIFSKMMLAAVWRIDYRKAGSRGELTVRRLMRGQGEQHGDKGGEAGRARSGGI